MKHPEVKVTILVEDVAGGPGLPGEHGFSCWICRGAHCMLFDTGQTELFLKNVHHLCFNIRSIHSLVLSHGHYDHTGGLRYLFNQTSDLKVFAHPEAFSFKYTQDPNGTIRSIGIPISKDDIEKHATIIPTLEPTEIFEGVYATGPIPRIMPFEDTGGNFFVDGTCHAPDPLMDDQSLFWESSHGTVILLGCAHAGVINTISHIRRLTGNKPVYAVLGGMHLLKASETRLEATLDAFRENDIKLIGPVHCTGSKAVDYFLNQIPNRFKAFRTGSSILFE